MSISVSLKEFGIGFINLLNSVGVLDMVLFFSTTGSPRGIAKLLFHRVNLRLFTFNHFVV
jgi:hypothetical protein